MVTKQGFAAMVHSNIRGVRNGEQSSLLNLWLLVSSLSELQDPDSGFGFDTWDRHTTEGLGAEVCREIGKRVCEEEGFTLEEALHLLENMPLQDYSNSLDEFN